MHLQIHRSPDFTFNPGDFVCDSSEIIARVFGQSFGGLFDDGRASEVELDN